MSLEYRGGPALLGQSINIGPERCSAILLTLNAGWQLALKSPDLHRELTEVEMTRHLRDGMRDALTSGRDAWCMKMTVLPGTESTSPNRRVPDGLTDIPLLFTDLRERLHDHDPQAVIECKRVAENQPTLCRRYVDLGIDDRFRSGKYSSRHVVGFMVGYLLAGTVRGTVGRINQRVSMRLGGAEVLGMCTVIDAPSARSSRHQRQGGLAPISLHHAFLGFA